MEARDRPSALQLCTYRHRTTTHAGWMATTDTDAVASHRSASPITSSKLLQPSSVGRRSTWQRIRGQPCLSDIDFYICTWVKPAANGRSHATHTQVAGQSGQWTARLGMSLSSLPSPPQCPHDHEASLSPPLTHFSPRFSLFVSASMFDAVARSLLDVLVRRETRESRHRLRVCRESRDS